MSNETEPYIRKEDFVRIMDCFIDGLSQTKCIDDTEKQNVSEIIRRVELILNTDFVKINQELDRDMLRKWRKRNYAKFSKYFPRGENTFFARNCDIMNSIWVLIFAEAYYLSWREKVEQLSFF